MTAAPGTPKPAAVATATAAAHSPSGSAAPEPTLATLPAAAGQSVPASQPPSGANSSAGGAAAPARDHEGRSKAALAAASPAPGAAGPAIMPAGGVEVVRGSGPTSVKGLMAAVVADFQKAQPLAGVSVTYDAVGSAQGANPSSACTLSVPYAELPGVA